MKYLPIVFLFASVGFNMLSNAKAVVYKYELVENNRFSPSIIELIKTYRNTLNENYKRELLVCIRYKVLANLSIVFGLVLLFS